MIVPSATYRLQFRDGMTFERAAGLAPYLARLGISHVYGSPIFKAEPGSTHGYDVVDDRVIDTELGGDEGFERMIAAFHAEGLGFILDFVPNHMSASPYNPYWRDVLEWGQASDCALFFDIDWAALKLLVPALATSYGQALEEGKFGLNFDTSDGGMTFSYGGLKLPITPPSYAHVLARIEGDEFAEWARRFALATPETSPGLKAELAAAAEENGARRAIENAIAAVAADSADLHELHEMQTWQLTYWRAARETLTYRRFFEIADLVGLKVESPRVFDELHAKVGELLATGSVNGLRLDHIDGLADPNGYLERLQKTFGESDPLYLVVEKILGPEEELRAQWPIAGTTGYEFIACLAGLLVDQTGEAAMAEAYDDFLGEAVDYASLVLDTKRRTITRNLAGELDRLKDMAGALAARHLETRDLGTDTLRRAIIELVAALPVYRTYVDVSGARDEDRAILAASIEKAKGTREVEDEHAIDFLGRALALDFDSPEDQASALEFATRLQQTSGPVMAKALEDTVFYRYNRLIALNEVGGEPDRFGAPVGEFHAAMINRLRRQAAGLSAASTHDTKRGEDARARLYVLSEIPGAWAAAVRRWSDLNRDDRREVDGVIVPEPETEWMFYQALAGVWPQGMASDHPGGLWHLSERLTGFMLKSVREAKVHTSWTGQNAPYEEAIESFTRAVLDPAKAHAFLSDFAATCEPIFVAGALNSIAQSTIRLAAPGVPDIYQGAELWDLSLVDPDNRRPVDFDHRRSVQAKLDATPETLIANWRSGVTKMFVLQTGLRVRLDHKNLFAKGEYVPMTVEGPVAEHVLAFARVHGSQAAIVVVPRLAFDLLHGRDTPFVPPELWRETVVRLPENIGGRSFHNIFTDETVSAGAAIPVAEILGRFAVSILVQEG
jgi:(1->4)-alpha-D-glucan 1-alpha-D-glucosylmutase